MPVFDKKYKIILQFKRDDRYLDMIEWVDKNSNGSVDMKRNFALDQLGPTHLAAIQTIFIGFEKEDDATFFKIKYSI
jgi:hypothetical protein